jgi:tRNA threonylcarbamoyladenosine biosynthesis protein TsaB
MDWRADATFHEKKRMLPISLYLKCRSLRADRVGKGSRAMEDGLPPDYRTRAPDRPVSLWHSGYDMHQSSRAAGSPRKTSGLVLGIDTCGPSGSVALGRLAGDQLALLGQTELAGRTYSSTLVTAVADLLAAAGAGIAQLDALVATHGPGSFTGVRVGLSAVKGLAEPFATPVVAVSRLAVLAARANTPSAALDAHRHEIFLLLLAGVSSESRELLAASADLAALPPPQHPIAVCDEAAAAVLQSAWPGAQLRHSPAPTAADVLALAVPRILARDFADLALLDGHYLRRSDAEIFGDPALPRSAKP